MKIGTQVEILVGSCKGMKAEVIEPTKNDLHFDWWVKIDCDKPGFKNFRAYKKIEIREIFLN